MAVEVREVTSDEDLRLVAEIDASSFGHPFHEDRFERSLNWRRCSTNYLALDDRVEAGSCRVHDFELSLPGGAVSPVAGIGDLGVLAGHRRRGVLGSMINRVLGDALAKGCLAAVLYASEATIYGRFGFGPATRSKQFSIETARAGFRNDIVAAPGRAELVRPAERREVMGAIFEQARSRRPGEVDRTPQRWDRLLAVPDGDSTDDRLCLQHVDPDGRGVAYALYTISPDWAVDGPRHRLDVLELVAIDDAAELAMWQALLSLDLIRSVHGWIAADSLLFDALADRWALHTVGEHDTLWVRLTDVGGALAARRYRVPGRLVLRVDEPTHPSVAVSETATGTFELSAAGDGTVQVAPTQADADLVLGVGELGSVWLGAGSLSGLAAVGRVQECRAGSLALADAMFGWSPSPRITHEF